jgi:hypothetical protein
MGQRARRATALGAAAFVLAGSAALGAPGAASADTKTVNCGDTVTAKPGDHIIAKTLLGVPLDLGIVTDGVTQLLSGLCKVTVNVVDTVVSPVPVVGAPAASAINQGVQGTTGSLQQGLGSLSGGQPNPQQPGSGGDPQQPPPAQGGGPGQSGSPGSIPAANSPLLPGAFTPDFGTLPWSLSTGWAPMRDYSGIPYALAGLYTPSPALRYGSQIPGYAPQYGLSNQEGGSGVNSAGQAQALPSVHDGFTNGSSLPVLLAVLALSGVSAGLVRTWVLRRTAAAN